MVVKTLQMHWHDAPQATRDAGRDWYPSTRRLAERLARRYGTTPEAVAGIIAALSQRMHWRRNLVLTVQCLKGLPLGCLRQVARKAERIRDGEHAEDVLGGNKIRAFYRAIMGDGEAVVLDAWMLRAMGAPRWMTDKRYADLAERLRRDAEAVGAEPAAFQAVVWVQVRGAAS